MEVYILEILLILISYGGTLYIKWILKNITFSKNPKVQKWAEIILKVVIVLLYCVLAYAIISLVLMILAPIFERLNAALNVAVGKLFDLVANFVPLAGLVYIGRAWWKGRQSQPPVEAANGPDPVDVEYAEQEASELHDDLGELIFNAVVDTSENTPFKRPRDPGGIETNREKPYTMDGTMAIHQFSVDTDTPLDKAGEDLALRELQRHINQRGKRYPQLRRDGLSPIIYDLKNNGNFIIVEVVLYSEKYKDKIEARRKARIARQQQTGDTYDRDF